MLNLIRYSYLVAIGISSGCTTWPSQETNSQQAATIARSFIDKLGMRFVISSSEAKSFEAGHLHQWQFGLQGPQMSQSVEIKVGKHSGMVEQFVHHRQYDMSEMRGRTGKARFRSPAEAKSFLVAMARRLAAKWPLALERWTYRLDNTAGSRHRFGMLSGTFWQHYKGFGYLSHTNSLTLNIDPQDGILVYFDQRYWMEHDPPRIKITQQQAIEAIRKYLAEVGARTKLTKPAKPVVLGYTVPWEQFGGPKSTDKPPYRGRLAYEIWVSKSSSKWVDAENGKILGGNDYSPIAG